MPPCSSRTRSAVIATVASLLSATVLHVVAAPATAAQTAAATTEVDELLDVHSYPGFLTLAGGGVHYDAPSIAGMVVTNLGYHEGHAPPADRQQEVWSTYGSSEPLPRSEALSDAYAIGAGYYGVDSNGVDQGLRLASLHRSDDGAVGLRLSLSQRQGFATSSIQSFSPLADDPVGIAMITAPALTGGDDEVLLLTGGPGGLEARGVSRYLPVVAEMSEDGLGRTIDVIDIHAAPRTDPSCDTEHLGCNGTATLLYRDPGDAVSGRPAGVVRATVVAQSVEGEVTLGLANTRHFALAGDVTHGQVRWLPAMEDRGFSTAVRLDDGNRIGNFLLEAFAQPVDPSIQGLCAGDGPPGLATYHDPADTWARTIVACSAVHAGTGSDLLHTGVVQFHQGGLFSDGGVVLSEAVPVPGLPHLSTAAAPVPLVDLPGLSAARSLEMTREAAGLPLSAEETKALSARSGLAVRSLVRGGAGAPDEDVVVASVSWTKPTEDGYTDADDPLVLTLPAARGQQPGAPLLGIPLGIQRNRVLLELATTSEDVNSNPVPIAFLQAPPTVGGAQQGEDTNATYGTTTGSSTSKGTSTATRIGATLGVEWEDPSGAFGVEVEANYTREVEQSYESGRVIETTESYTGAPEQDNVVFRSDKLRRYVGTVRASSLGVALGTDVEFDIPLGSVVSVASVPSLQARFPEFQEHGQWAKAIEEAFPHRVGNPGSYEAYGADGAVLDTFCDGTRSGGPTRRDVTPPATYTPVNPFIDRAETPPGPDIIIGERHSQVPGSGVIEGTQITITDEQAQAFVSSHSLDVDAGFKAGYVKAKVNAGATWGTDWSSSLSSGQGFTAEIASITSADLDQEGYDWRMFVCPKTVTGPGGSRFPAFVQGFLVDNYQGSGGLQAMSPVELLAPIESQVVDPESFVLTFGQEAGSVKRFDYRIEAVGRHHVITGIAATFEDPAAGTPQGDGNATGRSPSASFSVPEDLLANQLYRWRVTATDFFGTSITSDYEYFTVDGPPRVDLNADTLTPDAGAPVTFSNDTYVTDINQPYSCLFDFGDGTTAEDCAPTVEHIYAVGGTYNATLKVCASGGCGTDSLLLSVHGTAADDEYTVTEDSVSAVGVLRSVLSNDGGTTATLLQPTSHGAVTLRSDGLFSYAPDADFCGTDMFSYYVDGLQDRTATATIEVTCVQDAPRPVDDGYGVTEDQPLVVAAPGLLANDTDPDASPDAPVALEAGVLDEPEHGSLALAPDGGFRYEPAPDFCGLDGFRYEASDEYDSTPAEVLLTVACVNDPPTAVADGATVVEDDDARLDVVANDVDVDGDALVPSIVSQPERGTVAVVDGVVRFVPAPDSCGPDSFEYEAVDPDGAKSDPVVVSIEVTCVNDAPVATGDEYARETGARLVEVGAPGVLVNDTDVDSVDLFAELHSPPSSGEVDLRPDGSFTYVPNPSNKGGDSFWYRTSDGELSSDPVLVVITATKSAGGGSGGDGGGPGRGGPRGRAL